MWTHKFSHLFVNPSKNSTRVSDVNILFFDVEEAVCFCRESRTQPRNVSSWSLCPQGGVWDPAKGNNLGQHPGEQSSGSADGNSRPVHPPCPSVGRKRLLREDLNPSRAECTGAKVLPGSLNPSGMCVQLLWSHRVKVIMPFTHPVTLSTL